jgi:virulence-associated protein VapD
MFAIAFDLTVAEVLRQHPRSASAAYDEIGRVLSQFHFEWKQGSVYVSDNEDLANLVLALNALKALAWFPASVRDVRAFRVEQWSDFTGFMKSS